MGCGQRPGNPHAQGTHRSAVTSVAFSPDGKRIVSGSHDKTVKVWDAASGQEILTLKGHTDYVSAAWPSARTASGSSAAAMTRRVKMWDAASGQEILTLKGHTDPSHQRGLQPGREADRQRQRGQDGEGVGCGQRPGNAHAQGAHAAMLKAWPSARTGSGSSAAARTTNAEGVGRGQRPGNPHAQGAHGLGYQRGLQPGRQADRQRQRRTRR